MFCRLSQGFFFLLLFYHKTHVFLYARSGGCLVLLDFLLQQSYVQEYIKGVILSRPAFSFLDVKKNKEAQQELYKVIILISSDNQLVSTFSWRKGENSNMKFYSEFGKVSKAVQKQLGKVQLPILCLNLPLPDPPTLVDPQCSRRYFFIVSILT